MKTSDLYIMGISGIIVVFFMLTFFLNMGAHYGKSQSQITGNISINDFNQTLINAQDTAETFQNILESKNIFVGAFNLIIKGLPSAAKTLLRGSIDSVSLMFTSLKQIFATPAVLAFLGIIMALIVVIAVIVLLDWIRGSKPGA